MILVIDVGNTNTELGIIEGEKIIYSWRFVTKTPRTSDEYASMLSGFCRNEGFDSKEVGSVIVSSVVPNIMYSFNNGLRKLFGKEPMEVGPGIKTGMPILTSDPADVGADRIIDAVGAYNVYGGPCIVIDFGTATTYDYVTREGALAAKVTAPGIQICAEALFRNAAQLPSVAIEKPPSILAKDTVTSMQAGIVYGYIGQLEYTVNRMKEEINEPDIKVVATGGYGRMFTEESAMIDIYDAQLSLKGLKIIHDKNIKRRR